VWGQKPAQETFPTAEDAVVAMVDALKADDKPKLLSIFGPEVREVASSGNEAADRNGRGLFLAAYQERAGCSEIRPRRRCSLEAKNGPSQSL
jgi:hypothetical protein